VASGGSYLSESDRRLHWGLGGAAAYDALEVRWPDGTRQNLPGGPANRFLTLRQERN